MESEQTLSPVQTAASDQQASESFSLFLLLLLNSLNSGMETLNGAKYREVHGGRLLASGLGCWVRFPLKHSGHACFITGVPLGPEHYAPVGLSCHALLLSLCSLKVDQLYWFKY